MAVVLIVFFAVSYYREYKKFKVALPLQEEFEQNIRQMKILPKYVKLYVSDMTATPITFGIIHPVTKTPAETRMGKGKGALEYWVAVVKPGRVMFEISGVSEEVAREALRLATHKLPVKCKIVSRADLEGGAGSEE